MHIGGKYRIGVSARLLCAYFAALSLALVLISLAYSPHASAVTYNTGDGNLTITVGTPSGGGQTLCGNNRRADFRLNVSDTSITAQRNESTLKFDLTMEWRACDGNEVDAYALYGAPCPLTGYYGASSPYEANDCLKYVGPNISRQGVATDYPDYKKYLGCNPGADGKGGSSHQIDGKVCTTNKFPEIEIKRTRPGGAVTAAQTLTIQDIDKAIQSVDLRTRSNGNVTYSREVCSYFQQPAGTDRWGRCREVSIPITWTYTPHEYPPTGTITTATCSTGLIGTALDRNVQGTNRTLSVAIVIDGGASMHFVNSQAGGGEWRFPNVIRDELAHSYTVTVTGKNAAGANSQSVTLGTVWVGPCEGPPTGAIDSVTCSGISGTAFDPNISATTTLRVRVHIDTVPYDVYMNPNTHRWQLNYMPQDFIDHSIVVVIYGKNSAGNEDNRNVILPPQTFGHCAKVRCGSPTFSPISPEVGENFTVQLSLPYTGHDGTPSVANPLPGNNQPSPAAGYRLTLGGLINGNVGYSASNDSVRYTSLSLTRPTPGQYPITWSFTRGGTSAVLGGASCSGTIWVVVKPAVKVLGGDISAGNSFASDLASYPSSAILGWPGVTTGANAYSGSSTEFGAYASGSIFGFATSKRQTTAPGNAPQGLAFSNEWLIGDWYGGGFGPMPSIPDHAGMKPTRPNIDIYDITNASDALWLSGLSYQASNLTISSQLTVPRGMHSVIYVNGNLTINQNIRYDRSAPWTTKADIPALKFVVSGNINIAPGVTELNGVYIAQPRSGVPNTGIINTCSGFGKLAIYGNCQAPLTVNGSFTAKRIDLNRTGGSARSGAAAETFRYLPEVWMADWPATNNLTRSLRYDSMSNLAPIL